MKMEDTFLKLTQVSQYKKVCQNRNLGIACSCMSYVKIGVDIVL